MEKGEVPAAIEIWNANRGEADCERVGGRSEGSRMRQGKHFGPTVDSEGGQLTEREDKRPGAAGRIQAASRTSTSRQGLNGEKGNEDLSDGDGDEVLYPSKAAAHQAPLRCPKWPCRLK